MNPTFTHILCWDLPVFSRIWRGGLRMQESKLAQNLSWAVKSLSRNPKRSFATLSAVGMGFMGLVLLGGYIYRIERYLYVSHVYVNQQGHVTLFKKGGVEKGRARPARYSLTEADQLQIEEVLKDDARVERVGKRLEISGLMGSAEGVPSGGSLPFLAVGVEPETDLWARHHAQVQQWTPELGQLKAGKALGEVTHGDSVTLTQTLASKLGLKSGAWVQMASSAVTGRFEVAEAQWVGTHTTGMALTEETSVRMPLGLAQKLADTKSVTALAVYLKSDWGVETFAAALEKSLRARGLEVEVLPYANDRTGLFYTGGVSFLGVMGGFFLFLILGAVLLSIVNSFTLMLGDRRKELGTLKSLGFTSQEITKLLTLEGLTLAVVGVVTGLGLSMALSQWVNGLNIRFHSPGIAGDMQFVLTPHPLLTSVFALLLTGIVCAAAAWVASRYLKPNASQLLQTE